MTIYKVSDVESDEVYVDTGNNFATEPNASFIMPLYIMFDMPSHKYELMAASRFGGKIHTRIRTMKNQRHWQIRETVTRNLDPGKVHYLEDRSMPAEPHYQAAVGWPPE